MSSSCGLLPGLLWAYVEGLYARWRYTGAPLILLQLRISRNDLQFRSSGLDSLDDTLGETCAVCAEAVSTCVDPYAQGESYTHILETVYFTVIFLLRSIQDHALASFTNVTANRYIHLVLRTLVSWIDAIVFRCLCFINIHRYRFDLDNLKAKMVFMTLAQV